MQAATALLHELNFSWRDSLDILILSLLVYRVLVILWGTIANKLLWIFLGLAAIFVLAQAGELRATQFVLTRSYEIIVIVLLLVIQPELREGVARIGIGYFSAKHRFARQTVVDEVVKAITSLSAQRIGALLVMENSISLRSYTERSVPVHADVTNELLRTIFFPDTALHDGGVIIKAGRIEAAGCFFPLTRKELPSNLGTRHRAGVGISEQTDAFVIVVSEETGIVSIAFEGELTHVHPGDLGRELEAWFRMPTSSATPEKATA